MANEITRLLPFRQYDENDVINFYSLDAETGEAGSVVKVSAATLVMSLCSMLSEAILTRSSIH